ncbi:hypothetical protein BJ085DRAFT_29644 [Dimargaris cristalligena]|uniref:DUF221-domain-containing protein n=1 Tax=Dimargaris cristalligena TaxID=215637 RepID=A0A4P9ZZT5_9FUNG|nr:hypothetical protein BJ085DRAFT_29644 [Dimargaris cristalligena]|eukprot:RKP38958.1 hypothetical protein BJ085DRAFT_29644 [Dimargaris cristalligena]
MPSINYSGAVRAAALVVVDPRDIDVGDIIGLNNGSGAAGIPGSPTNVANHTPSLTTQLGWLLPVINTSEMFMLQTVGLDAVMFLRFFKLSIAIFCVLAVPGLCILIPINVVGSNDDSEAFLSMNSMPDASPYLVVHLIFVYVFSLVVYYYLLRYSYHFLALRWHYLLRNAGSVESRSVMVTNIPGYLQNPAMLRKFFQELDIGKVEEVYIVGQSSDLPALVKSRAEHLRKLETMVSKLIGNPCKAPDYDRARLTQLLMTPTPEAAFEERVLTSQWMKPEYQRRAARNPKYNPRPTVRLPTGRWFRRGPRVDGIDYHKERFLEFDRLVRSLRLIRSQAASSGPPPTVAMNVESGITNQNSSVGFVTFEHSTSAHIASQTLTHAKPFACITRLAPEPCNVYWNNLTTKKRSRVTRTILVFIAMVFLTFFWGVPVAFLSSFLSLESLGQHLSFVKDLAEWNSVMQSLFSYTLPSVVMISYFNLLPAIIQKLAEFKGLRVRATMDIFVLSRVFFFQIFNVLLVFTLSSTLWNSLFDIFDDPTQVTKKLASSLPQVAPFFINYIIMLGIGYLPFKLLQVFPMIWTAFRRYLCTTPRDFSEVVAPIYVAWGARYPVPMLVFVITLTYSNISPLILVFGILYFLLGFLFNKYLFLYVYFKYYESSGRVWPYVVRRLVVCMYIYHLLMFGLFSLKDSWVVAILTVPTVAMNSFFFHYINKILTVYGDCVPLYLLRLHQRRREELGRLKAKHLAAQAAATAHPHHHHHHHQSRTSGSSYPNGRRGSNGSSDHDPLLPKGGDFGDGPAPAGVVVPPRDNSSNSDPSEDNTYTEGKQPPVDHLSAEKKGGAQDYLQPLQRSPSHPPDGVKTTESSVFDSTTSTAPRERSSISASLLDGLKNVYRTHSTPVSKFFGVHRPNGGGGDESGAPAAAPASDLESAWTDEIAAVTTNSPPPPRPTIRSTLTNHNNGNDHPEDITHPNDTSPSTAQSSPRIAPHPDDDDDDDNVPASAIPPSHPPLPQFEDEHQRPTQFDFGYEDHHKYGYKMLLISMWYKIVDHFSQALPSYFLNMTDLERVKWLESLVVAEEEGKPYEFTTNLNARPSMSSEFPPPEMVMGGGGVDHHTSGLADASGGEPPSFLNLPNQADLAVNADGADDDGPFDTELSPNLVPSATSPSPHTFRQMLLMRSKSMPGSRKRSFRHRLGYGKGGGDDRLSLRHPASDQNLGRRFMNSTDGNGGPEPRNSNVHSHLGFRRWGMSAASLPAAGGRNSYGDGIDGTTPSPAQHHRNPSTQSQYPLHFLNQLFHNKPSVRRSQASRYRSRLRYLSGTTMPSTSIRFLDPDVIIPVPDYARDPSTVSDPHLVLPPLDSDFRPYYGGGGGAGMSNLNSPITPMGSTTLLPTSPAPSSARNSFCERASYLNLHIDGSGMGGGGGDQTSGANNNKSLDLRRRTAGLEFFPPNHPYSRRYLLNMQNYDQDQYDLLPDKYTDYNESPMELVHGILDSGIRSYQHPCIVGKLPELWLPTGKGEFDQLVRAALPLDPVTYLKDRLRRRRSSQRNKKKNARHGSGGATGAGGTGEETTDGEETDGPGNYESDAGGSIGGGWLSRRNSAKSNRRFLRHRSRPSTDSMGGGGPSPTPLAPKRAATTSAIPNMIPSAASSHHHHHHHDTIMMAASTISLPTIFYPLAAEGRETLAYGSGHPHESGGGPGAATYWETASPISAHTSPKVRETNYYSSTDDAFSTILTAGLGAVPYIHRADTDPTAAGGGGGHRNNNNNNNNGGGGSAGHHPSTYFSNLHSCYFPVDSSSHDNNGHGGSGGSPQEGKEDLPPPHHNYHHHRHSPSDPDAQLDNASLQSEPRTDYDLDPFALRHHLHRRAIRPTHDNHQGGSSPSADSSPNL